MKLIDKRGNKDYYDYLIGIYGEDPKIALDRREAESIYPFGDKSRVVVWICDYIFEGFYYNKKYHWGEDLLKFATDYSKEQFLAGKKDSIQISEKYCTEMRAYNCPHIIVQPYISSKKTNTVENCPILMNSYGVKKYSKFPKLIDIGIKKILPPKTIYLMLTQWLAPKEEFIDNRTNNEKVVSAGFDLKDSFRNTR